MDKPHQIGNDIYLIRVNDPPGGIFENLWPLDKGLMHNTYLCTDEHITLIGCPRNNKLKELLDNRHEWLPGNRTVDFLIVNHLTPDHTEAIRTLVKVFPGIKIVGNRTTLKSLTSYFIEAENFFEIKNNTRFNTGKHTFRFITTPMLHGAEAMMTFHEPGQLLFSGDAFGCFGLTKPAFDDEPFETYNDEFIRYFSNVLGKYHKNVYKALMKIEALKPVLIASTYGPVWKQHVSEVIAWYNKFAQHWAEPAVMMLYGSMYGNTTKLAEHIYEKLSEKGIQVSLYDASTTHVSYILTGAFLSKGIIIGAPTFNGTIFPWVDFALQMLAGFDIRQRYVGVFGSKTWSSGITQKIIDRIKTLDWELVHDPFENLCAPSKSGYELANSLAQKMALKMEHVKKERINA